MRQAGLQTVTRALCVWFLYFVLLKNLLRGRTGRPCSRRHGIAAVLGLRGGLDG